MTQPLWAHDPPTHVYEQHRSCNNSIGDGSTVPATVLVLCTQHTPGNKEIAYHQSQLLSFSHSHTWGSCLTAWSTNTQMSLQNVLGLEVRAAGVSGGWERESMDFWASNIGMTEP